MQEAVMAAVEAVPMARYNGWSNRETWLANLWLTVDAEMYGLLLDTIRETSSPSRQADKLADRLQYMLNEECLGSGFWSDLIRTAFGRINWLEVVESNRE
jgi:hypothetical protein